MATALKQVLAQLESLGDEKVRAHHLKWGAGKKKQFGVPMGEIRKLAAKIRTDHALAQALWKTRNIDAQLLAVLLFDPRQISARDLDRLVRTGDYAHVADWLNSYVVKNHPDRESLRVKWMEDDDPWAARAGWSLTNEQIVKKAKSVEPAALLDRIETEMGGAPPATQWTMNFCLAGIGIHHPKLRKRAIAIGEDLGIYRDYPVSKGCTSPFAPVWIREMVKRQK